MKKGKQYYIFNSNVFLFLFLCLGLLILFTPDLTVAGKFDRRCWINWSNYMLGNGLNNVYRFEIDYLPLYNYFLYGYAFLLGSPENIIQNINSLKYLTILFELIGIAYLIDLVRNSYKSSQSAILISLLVILNPAYLYDSILFGQIDGIYSTFVFISVYYAIKANAKFSLLAFVFAINFKLQAIVFLPLVLLLNINLALSKISFTNFLKVIMPAVIVQLAILLPFWINGDLKLILNIILDSKGKYPMVSMGGLNFWYLFFDNPKQIVDSNGIWNKSYHVIGLAIFIFLGFLVLFPLMVWKIRIIQGKVLGWAYPTDKVLLIGVLLPLIFFYFNTQMHARYIHPAIIFAGAYALYTKRFWIYILISLAYFLNIEWASKILKGDISEYTYLVFNPVFVSSLFLLVLIIGFKRLYKGFKLFGN